MRKLLFFCLLSLSTAWGRDIPKLQQTTDVTCGVICVRASLLAEGLFAPSELALWERLIHHAWGRDPTLYDLAEVARDLGLQATVEWGMTLPRVKALHRSGERILLNWNFEGVGHCSLFRDYDGVNVYLMDPWVGWDPAIVPVSYFLGQWYQPVYFYGGGIRFSR